MPQGAIPSPFLFNIYTSNISLQDDTLAANYGDDTVIIARSETGDGASIIVEQHVNEIERWLKNWRTLKNL